MADAQSPKDPGFTHLHLHTQYSLLDGAIHMDALCPAVKERGMDAVAVTDHGNMYGAVHFYQQAQKHGVKAIMGCEAYVAQKGRHNKKQRSSAHMILLAKNNEGYKNLNYLVSMGFMEGYYYNPRIDAELLKKHSKGIYATSACLGGIVNKTLLKEGEAKAAEVAKEYSELFEPGHFFLEIQNNGYEIQKKSNDALMNISELYDIPLIATADSHYLSPEDSDAHEILMCIGQNRSLDEMRAGSFKHSDELYVKTPQQMYDAFKDISLKAIENAQMVSRNCNVELNLSETYLPNFGVPDGYNRETYIEKLSNDGLKKRLEEAHYDCDISRYKERLDYELGVITKMGFAGYFLIVWDFINQAKTMGIPVGPGRGSGAGSLVAYALRITDLDPLPYDLLFERFLNPERVSMPDFDIDFCQYRRGEVINYVAEKYGRENVGQICTYSALSAKSVIKDVGRVLGLPFAEVNALTKLIPGLINGKKVSIDKALEVEPKLREIQEEKPIYKEVINISRQLEGLNRQTGMHAAGIVIGDKKLWEYVPVCRGKNGELITQFAKDEVEAAGLVKFDFLGLKTLTVVDNAVKHVHKRDDESPVGKNSELDIEALHFDDPKVYELIASADTDGVFQLESSGFKEMLKRLRPDRFEDIVAGVALYRPGPLDAGMVEDYIARKHGRKKVEYPHPVCEDILKPTYGVIVYQEQVMRIAVSLAGFTMGQADTLRKAMGKKKADVMAKMKSMFVDGAFENNDMPKDQADALFTSIEKFAGYAFNKSHSAAYAVITYRTAWLKTYFPVEFYAALMSTEMGVQENVVRYIQSARESGIEILPPDANLSDRDFSVEFQDGVRVIRFGLGAVKGLGDAAIEAIIEARDDGHFTSIYKFCERVEGRKINRRSLEVLVKSGAFDGMGKERYQNFAAVEGALERGAAANKDRRSGQTSLFAAFAQQSSGPSHDTGAGDEYYPEDSILEWSQKQKLKFEKEAVGFYITGHPLDSYLHDLPRLCSVNTRTMLDSVGGGQRYNEVTIGGVVSAFRERPLKSGKGRMGFITLEDLHGTCEILVFSRVFAECEMVIKSDEPILVKGAIMVDGDEENAEVKLRAAAIESLADARAKTTQNIHIQVGVDMLSPERLQKFKEILVRHPGPIPVKMTLKKNKQFETVLALPPSLTVHPSEDFISQVDRLFGAKVVRLG